MVYFWWSDDSLDFSYSSPRQMISVTNQLERNVDLARPQQLTRWTEILTIRRQFLSVQTEHDSDCMNFANRQGRRRREDFLVFKLISNLNKASSHCKLCGKMEVFTLETHPLQWHKPVHPFLGNMIRHFYKLNNNSKPLKTKQPGGGLFDVFLQFDESGGFPCVLWSKR